MVLTAQSSRVGRPRVGLVLGAGGVLGAAWMAGALNAVQQRLDRRLCDVDMIVGTSAGSVMGAALRCGVEIDAILAHQRGTALITLPHLAELDRDSGRLPPLPRLRFGSPRLLASTARAPHRMHPWVAASALMLEGRAQHRSLASLVHALLAQSVAAQSVAAQSVAAAPAGIRSVEVRSVGVQSVGIGSAATLDWPHRPIWIVAVDYESGRRMVFGRAGSPVVSLPDAVVASCSIPGWYEPKRIGDRRYIDGGVRSNTSLDVLASAELDHVYVLAPMASLDSDSPRNPVRLPERLVRQYLTRGLAGEVHKVEASGARVTVLTPGPEDLVAFGVNLMDPARRELVLETSLRTSPARLAALDQRGHAA